jgi:hypothetical protein
MANRTFIQTNQAKFSLKFFLGDNENAIKIQIYCVLIVNLLMGVVKKSLKRKWSFLI